MIVNKTLHIDPEYITLFDYRNSDWFRKFPALFHTTSTDTTFWHIGHHYVLERPSCEGFDMPRYEYELKGIIKEYNGIEINSVIVKQVGGLDITKYTISKNDCDNFGIEYEPQLELLPMSLHWQKAVNYEVTFDSSDFATMPVNPDTGMLHAFVIQLHGLEKTRFPHQVYYKPLDAIISLDALISSLTIYSKQDIRNAQDSMMIWHTSDDISEVSDLYYVFTDEGFYIIVDITPHTNNCEINPREFPTTPITNLLDICIPTNCFTTFDKYKQQLQEREEIRKRQAENARLKERLLQNVTNVFNGQYAPKHSRSKSLTNNPSRQFPLLPSFNN